MAGLSKQIAEVGAHTRSTLIIWGEHDESVPIKDCLPIYEKSFKTHIRVFKNTKHSGFLERKEETNKLILQFIDGELKEEEKKTIFL